MPRVFTPPLRELTARTSKGFECIRFAEDVLNIELLPWQKWLLIHALELLPDGSFRFRTVVLLVARQNGKSTLMQVLTLWRMYVDNAPLVIGTAQDLDTAEEQWEFCIAMAEEIPDLADEVETVSKTNGKKFLRLLSGSRYKVRAASRRGGRGLSGDLVLLDELREHATFLAWAAVTKTTMARHRAQVWAASNAGDRTSVVLNKLRRLAHLALGDPDGLWTDEEKAKRAEDVRRRAGEAADDEGGALGIFEWSAEPGCDVWDRDGWAQANPSLGYTITERALASAAETDGDGDDEEVFRTECLCQWVDQMVPPLIPVDDWGGCKDEASEVARGLRFALDVAPNRASAAIGAAGYRVDGLPHVEITSADGIVDHRPGVEWVAPRLAELSRNWPGVAVTIVKGSPAESLVSDLEKLGVLVELLPASEVPAACGRFFDKATTRGLRHLGNAELVTALRAARRKQEEGGENGWVWGRRRSSGDITALYAVTLALWSLLRAEPPGFAAFGDLDLCDVCVKEKAVVATVNGDYLCRDCLETEREEEAEDG